MKSQFPFASIAKAVAASISKVVVAMKTPKWKYRVAQGLENFHGMTADHPIRIEGRFSLKNDQSHVEIWSR